MNTPAVKSFARCIVHDIARVFTTAYRVARYYLPFHVRGLARSIFQPSGRVVMPTVAKCDKPRSAGEIFPESD